MVKSSKQIVSLIIGIILILTTMITYWRNFDHVYELTFLSNFATGLAFAAMSFMKENRFSQILCLDFTILLFMVLLVCVTFSNEFGFSGGWLFLHLINPLIVMIYFIVMCDMREIKRVSVLTVLIMPVMYLLFAVIYGKMTGNYIYFFLDYKTEGIMYSVIFILILAVCIMILSYGVYFLNRFIHRKQK